MKKETKTTKEKTPFQKFEELAKKIVATPKDRIDREKGKKSEPSS